MHSLVFPNLVLAEKNKYICPVKVIHQILYVFSSLLYPNRISITRSRKNLTHDEILGLKQFL